MKCIIALFAFSALFVTITADDSQREEAMKAMKKIFHECQDTLKLPEDELSFMRKHEAPATQGQKCFVGCFMEKAKLINANGFDRAEADKISKQFFTDEKLTKALEANENCEKEVEHVADNCVTGPEVLKCLLKYTPYFKED